MNKKRRKIDIGVIFRKATSIVLMLTLCFCGIPFQEGMKEEAYGAGSVKNLKVGEPLTSAIVGTMTLDFSLGDTPIGRLEIDVVDFGRTAPQLNIAPYDRIYVPVGSVGELTGTIGYSANLTGGGITFGSGIITDKTALNATTTCAVITDRVSIPMRVGFTYAGKVASNTGIDVETTTSFDLTLIAQSPWTVRVNGTDSPVSIIGDAYKGTATVETPTVSLEIKKETIKEGKLIFESKTNYTMLDSNNIAVTSSAGVEGAVNFTLPGSGTYNIQFDNELPQLNFSINYQAPPPPPTPPDSGGDGGGSSGDGGDGSSGGGNGGGDRVTPQEEQPAINVVNQENKPNESSDNILTPMDTQENGGTSSTVVTTKEMEALLDLAEQHKNDVPEGERQIIIKIEDSKGVENKNYEVFIPGGELLKAADSPVDVLVVETSAGDFRVRSENFQVLGRSDVTIKLGKINYDGRPGVDAKLMSGEKIITGFEDAALGIYSVEIRIPYEAAPGEDVSALVIEYMREDGTTEIVTEAIYDEVNKCLRFFPTHLSKYGVSYNPKVFKDVKSTHWASGAITFLAARKVLNGREDGTFRPDDKVTKAEFITMMTTAFSAASLGKRTVKSYKDVPLDAWYAKAVGWSYLNNISNVIATNGKLHPGDPLSREDMATLSNNISLGLNLKLKEKKPAINFKDSKAIAGYAVPGVNRMCKCGIVAGTSSGNFMPKSGLTRAEAASIISTLMAGMK